MKLSLCTETNYERILASYTCPLFEGVSEPVYQARIEMMSRYGAVAAVSSMLPRHDPNPEGEQ